jgi:hypothetical protein
MEKLSLTGKSKHSTDDAMKGLSALFVDGDKVFVDNGAIHAKSNLERGLTFVKTKDEVANPRLIWVMWITLHRFEDKIQGYYGAMPFQLWIDEDAQVGYKSLADQVNKMDKAVKGNVDVSAVPTDVLEKVQSFLQSIRPDLWEHASSTFRAAFSTRES